MATQNSGTLVTAAIRPQDDEILISSVLSNEAKGGHHMYKTLAERGDINNTGIMEPRREWGMLCTVYDDGVNNGTYQLVYKASSPSITDNLNWRVFSGSPQSMTVGEWLPSVLSIVDSPPTGITGGDRFLITSPGYLAFSTQSNRVAEWDSSALSGSGDWVYSTPTNGSTLRVDNVKNVLFKFLGTWSEGGYWQREYLSQIRYIQPTSINGSIYTFTSSTDMVALDAYSYSIYLANFGYTSSGSSTLEIDGLGSYPMKKISANSKLDIASEDLIPGIQYHISWNTDGFLVHGFGGGASAGVIGPAEDGTYSDGLFTDFNPSTPIGVPIDRFNEILLALVPPPAPDLSSWSLGGPSFVNGRLSFDVSNPSGLVPVPGVSVGGDFNASGFRKGINSFVLQTKTTDTYYKDYTGVLAYSVARGPGDPTPAYATNSFGNGITGSLVLKLNGATISNESLANKTAINTTSDGAQSGLIISAATSSKFPSGVPFEFFWHRTGSFLIKKDDVNLRQGFNYLDLSHILPSQTLTLASYSWVADPSTTETTFTSNNINNIVGSNARYISGIRYWSSLTLKYQVTLQNHVKNTYIASNALSSTSSVPGGFNGINGKLTTTTTPIMGPPINKSINTPSTPNSPETITWDYTTNNSVRRLNESISFSTQVLRTVQGIDTSPLTTTNNYFIDNYAEDAQFLVENFTSENYRIRNGGIKYDPSTSTVAGFSALTWDKTQSLNTSIGYQNGLQILNGQLVYPKFDYYNVGTAQTNPNKSVSVSADVLYNLCDGTVTGFAKTNAAGTNYRTFTRYFKVDPSNTFAKLRFVFELSNTVFVNADQDFTNSNQCWIEVKLPHDTSRSIPVSLPALIGSSVTGWLDMTKKALPGQWNDGNGVYTGTPTGTQIDIDFGQGKSTYYSGGYILFRITAPPIWTGHISKITVTTI